MSTTVTLNDFEVALPATSVAVQVTLVVPSANAVPDGGTHALTTPGTLSDAGQ